MTVDTKYRCSDDDGHGEEGPRHREMRVQQLKYFHIWTFNARSVDIFAATDARSPAILEGGLMLATVRGCIHLRPGQLRYTSVDSSTNLI